MSWRRLPEGRHTPRLCALVAALALGAPPPAPGAVLGSGTFRSPTAVIVLDGTPGVPYPSTIEVAGLGGALTGVVAGFADFEHLSPRDTDALLVSPAGTAVLLMADACGLVDMINVNLVFDDAAATALPEDGPCPAAGYRPSDYAPADVFPAPAPPGPWASALAPLLGEDPNGTWSLYVVDDLGVGDSGRIEWWTLTLTTDPGFLFGDGFETGNAARWTAAVPGPFDGDRHPNRPEIHFLE
jgi:hypothetical protein